MTTVERIVELITEKGVNEKTFLQEIGLNSSALSDWKSGKNKSYKKHIDKIAAYFNVSADYILCKQGVPLVVPGELEGAYIAFHRGEFEDLTQTEIDALANIAKTFKEQRKARESESWESGSGVE